MYTLTMISFFLILLLGTVLFSIFAGSIAAYIFGESWLRSVLAVFAILWGIIALIAIFVFGSWLITSIFGGV